MEKPLVSIIIPTYNRAHLIGETLDSIIAQTYTNWECIVVDDGSSDLAYSFIHNYSKKDSRISILKRPSNLPKGANSCRNYGISLSKGAYIIAMDSDDLLHEKCLEWRMEVIEKNDVDFVVFQTESFVGEKGNQHQIFSKYFENNESYLEAFLSYDIPWQTMAPMYKKHVFNNYQFDTRLMRLQDIDMAIRILLDNKTTFKLNKKTDCFYRTEESSGKNKSLQFQISVAKSFGFLYENALQLICHNKKLKKKFARFILIILFSYYYTNYAELKNETENLLSDLKKKSIFPRYQLMVLYILYNLRKYKILRIKGIGIFTFDKILRNKMMTIYQR